MTAIKLDKLLDLAWAIAEVEARALGSEFGGHRADSLPACGAKDH